MKTDGNEMGMTGVLVEAAAEETASRLPDRKFRAGGVTATVWKGMSAKGTPYFNVQLNKSYKDKDNAWKNTNSLKETDIPKAMVLLQKAYEYVILEGNNAHVGS